jgi:DNA-binding NtrC family response regulator
LLVDYFIQKFAKEIRADIAGIDPEALELLKNYNWPGNVRQLQNVLQQAILETPGPILLASRFKGLDLKSSENNFASPTTQPDSLRLSVRESIQRGESNLLQTHLLPYERAVIEATIEECGKNMTRAANLLGLHRTTLKTRMQLLGLEKNA